VGFAYHLSHPVGAARKLRVLARELRDLPAACQQLNDAVVQAGGLPLPPAHLQKRVAKVFDGTWVSHGESLLRDIQDFLGPVMLNGRVLDFGCGPGRLIRALHYNTPATLCGCDIDAEAIEWCQAHLPGAFVVNDVHPPLPYEGESFDVVIGLSVFTHLPEEHQEPWLQELRRVVVSGGHLFLSYHGQRHVDRIPVDQKQSFRTAGFAYFGGPTAGLPLHYRATVHSDDYIRREWGKVFEVVKLADGVIDDFQGGVLLRR
jgi:SAM-dependent methyltransferase